MSKKNKRNILRRVDDTTRPIRIGLASRLDFDENAGGYLNSVYRFYCTGRRLGYIYNAFMRSHLKLFAGFFINVWTT